MRIFLIVVVSFLLVQGIWGCNAIAVGKNASVDGSVMVSQTDCEEDCRIRIIKGKKYKKGAMAPIYFGMVKVKEPEIVGYIPQVEETYTYFHSAYSQMNEHQLAMGEVTIGQRPELIVTRKTGKQIMTVEQAQAFALQRCKKAREAVKLIGSLIEKYGFIPSCWDGGESICIGDTQEVWVMEMYGVGPEWDPKSGKPGAVWAAQRLPDDHITLVPSASIIKTIDLSKPDQFMASKNYMQEAIDRGYYDPASGEPFIWQNIYTSPLIETSVPRFWLFFHMFAPDHKKWADHKFKNSYEYIYTGLQVMESRKDFPFSVKPKNKLSVQDIMAYQRATLKDTVWDDTADHDWLIPDYHGKNFIKSPLTTPFPSHDMRMLLDIKSGNYFSSIIPHYGMVSQSRDWLPDEIGGVYWVFLDRQYVSTYVPIYAGVNKISPYYYTYDPNQFSEKSAKWLIDFVDNLLHLKWQKGIQDLKKVRDPLEKSFFDNQKKIEAKALKLYKKSPKKAKQYLTQYTLQCMDKTVQLYKDLRNLLITKYTIKKPY